MTHILLQTVVGADDNHAGDATELKGELDEDRVRCVVSFPIDQYWSPVGTIRDLAFGVVFFYFGSVVGPCLYLDDVCLSCICVKWRL